MGEHTNLPPMVGFVSKHVAQHFRANRPRPGPAVSEKLLDAGFIPRTALTIAERCGEHLRAASGALGQSRTSLLRRAVRAVELSWNLQMRSGKPHPLAADVVHVREDCRNGASRKVAGHKVAGFTGRLGSRWFGSRWFGSPGGRVKMFDKHLVHAIIGGKDLDRGQAEWSVKLGFTRGHGSLILDL